jgi:two-component system, cell cycle sensor histidine kinase and response regulator CckA
MENKPVVLIVDDNPANLRSLGDMLEADYEVRVANSGPTALESINASAPDLILLDAMMPGMDGYEVCRWLKVNPDFQMIPVIFISALGESEPKIRAFREGAVDYITKPFYAEEVEARVRTHIKLSKLEDLKREITERKRGEEKIRAQAELLDLAQDAIAARDMEGRVQYWNKSCERLTGWSAVEAIGRPIIELLKPDLARYEESMRVLMKEGHCEEESTATGKDGRSFTVMSRWTLVRDEQGKPKSVLSINTDITEQKKLEEQFLRAQRTEAIGALASGIAHDLNNILAPIIMTAPFLREAVSDPEIRQMIDTVETCANRGADIIKQLLTFARGAPGTRAPLPVRHLLKEMDKLIRETFPRNIQPCINTPNDLWPVLGDATQIHQTFLNLCVNARDAMPNGGTLTLKAENTTLDQHFAATTPDAKPGKYVCLSVTDTGMGIPPENLSRIFDPFFTTKEIGKGTGLGLATVLGIVRGHGGFVRVDSQVGQGTTFKLFLPASPEAKAADALEREILPPRGHGELILVVDDEATVREAMLRVLEKHNYRVMAAAEGKAALAIFASHRSEIKVVITDMMMPGTDGSGLVQALRHLDPRLPILGMTGLTEGAAAEEFKALDLVAIIRKPFARVELLSAIQTMLATKT